MFIMQPLIKMEVSSADVSDSTAAVEGAKVKVPYTVNTFKGQMVANWICWNLRRCKKK